MMADTIGEGVQCFHADLLISICELGLDVFSPCSTIS